MAVGIGERYADDVQTCVEVGRRRRRDARRVGRQTNIAVLVNYGLLSGAT